MNWQRNMHSGKKNHRCYARINIVKDVIIDCTIASKLLFGGYSLLFRTSTLLFNMLIPDKHVRVRDPQANKMANVASSITLPRYGIAPDDDAFV
ncbi:unnamed protein product [Clavelina lepadiformis]|uniref:Uncharacterized protein n=1 Tax=Clavelina lepadiformis TaxID=159417 RepID=A0ABP0FWE5_CLALP